MTVTPLTTSGGGHHYAGVSDIASRLAQVQSQIAQAVVERGPGPAVRLIAVSKRHCVDAIEEAYLAGARDFGENYVQELEQKASELKTRCPEIRWHMIGPLQRNKVPKVVGRALIHTVDRLSLIEALGRRAKAQGLIQDCLVQVNPGESQKSGIEESQLSETLGAISSQAHLSCRGLMIIPPQNAGDVGHPHFAWLAGLAQTHLAGFSGESPELSMGMSGDFRPAILAGATMVRVGTAIFGPRRS